MWLVWPGLQLRMRLSGDKPWVLRDFDHFYNPVVRRESAQSHAAFLQVFPEIIVYFIAMAVTLMDFLFSIELFCQCPFF